MLKSNKFEFQTQTRFFVILFSFYFVQTGSTFVGWSVASSGIESIGSQFLYRVNILWLEGLN